MNLNRPFLQTCFIIAVVAELLLMLCVTSTKAIPLFARKYGTTCFTCHTTEPLLNDFGRRFQAAGYQLPGSAADPTSQSDQGAFPIAMVAHPSILHEQEKGGIADSSTSSTSFGEIELAFFSTGHLGPHFSYFAEVPVLVHGQEVSVDVVTAELLWTDVLDNGMSNLNFRMGKITPMIAYPANVLLSNADPLVDTYYPFPVNEDKLNSFILAEPMFGISAFGLVPQVLEGLRWELGFYGGNYSAVDLAKGHAIFASLDQTAYLDDAPIRLGVSYMAQSPSSVPMLAQPSLWDNMANRMSVNLDITDPWTKRVEISSQYMRAFNSNLDSAATAVNANVWMLGAQVIVVPERLYAFARVDYAESRSISEILRQFDIGLRYHLLPNVVLTVGVSRLIQSEPGLVDRVTSSESIGVLFGF